MRKNKGQLDSSGMEVIPIPIFPMGRGGGSEAILLDQARTKLIEGRSQARTGDRF